MVTICTFSPRRPRRGQLHLRLDTPFRCAGARHHRQRRHVVVCRRTAAGAGRLRHSAQRRLAPLHDGDDRLRVRRRRDGAARRPLWHRVPGDPRNGAARALAISAAGYRAEHLDAQCRACVDRLRHVRRRSARSSPTCRTGSRSGVASRSASRHAATTRPAPMWPPIVQHFIVSDGWRATHIGIAIFCVVTMVPLMLLMRRRSPVEHAAPGVGRTRAARSGSSRTPCRRCSRSPASRAASRWRCRRCTSSRTAPTRLRRRARRRDAVADARALG